MAVKIRMINGSQGIPVDGKPIEVSEDRAERWVFQKKCAVFMESKDKKAAEKRIEEAEEARKKADEELNKKLDELEAE